MAGFRFLQRFFSFFLLLLGIVLVVVAVCNYFVAPIPALMEDPSKGRLIYTMRLMGAIIVALAGLFGTLGGKGTVHLMLATGSIAIGAGLYFVCEWYIAVAVIALSFLSAFFNFVLSFERPIPSPGDITKL